MNYPCSACGFDPKTFNFETGVGIAVEDIAKGQPYKFEVCEYCGCTVFMKSDTAWINLREMEFFRERMINRKSLYLKEDK